MPLIEQIPFPALVRPDTRTERGAFAQFGGECPWPEAHPARHAVLRRRDREADWIAKDPMVRRGADPPSGRSRQMGSKAIEALILCDVECALKTLPAPPPDPEPPVPPAPPERPPLFWITDIQYERIQGQ